MDPKIYDSHDQVNVITTTFDPRFRVSASSSLSLSPTHSLVDASNICFADDCMHASECMHTHTLRLTGVQHAHACASPGERTT